MRAEYINPFLTSMISVFDSMLGCKLRRCTPYLATTAEPEWEISGVIGLSGKAKGMVVISLSREAALSAAGALLGERPAAIGPDVTDAIGELTNIVAGNAKAKLEHLCLSVSLPTVVTGKGQAVKFPHGASPICIPFDSEWGRVVAMVGLVELTTPVEIPLARALLADSVAAP